MSARLVRTLLAVFLLATFLPSVAGAERTDPAAAEALFQKGRDAMDAGDFESACQLFEKSLALDHAVGTIMNLAACEKERGQLARSWERWHQALDLLDEDDDRVGYAVIQLESVEGRLAHLTIVAQKGAPKDLTLRRDDVVLGSAGLGQELPVDPGKHVIVVESSGHEPKRYTVSLQAGERREMEVGPGRPVQSGGTLAQRNTRKTLGIVALGVGALGLTTAITTGALLPGQHQKVEEGCPSKVCTAEGAQAVSGARTLVALNTAGWIVAGVGAAAGVTLMLTLPNENEDVARRPSRKATVGVAVLGSGLRLFGSF